MRYINVHTHLHSMIDNTVEVRSLSTNDIAQIEADKLYTVGIHPWYAHQGNMEEQLNILKTISLQPNVIGIGEIGLDKLRGPTLDVQKRVFAEQLAIAQAVNKPVIIHCVKAWDELVRMKKGYDTGTLQWAIHGFRGNARQALQLVKLGFYLSFGHHILDSQSKVLESLEAIPLNRLFLETDDSGATIADLYNHAAQRLNKTPDDFARIIEANFNDFFNR